MIFEIKEDLIYSNELDSWVFIEDYLTMIVNDAAEMMKHSATLKFVSASDAEGNRWQYPTIRTFTKEKSELVCQSLIDQGIPAQVDLYEDDDGDDEYGRSIMRQIWSVQIPDLVLDGINMQYARFEDTIYKWDNDKREYVKIDEIEIPCSKDLDNQMYNESI